MIKAPSPTAGRFYTYDGETRFNEQGEVQHWASARNNLVRVPLDVLDAVNPANNIIATVRELDRIASQGPVGALFVALFGLGAMALAVLKELLEIVALPFFILKDLVDAGVHVGAAVTNGRAEGEEQPLDDERSRDRFFAPTVDTPGPKLAAPATASGVSLVARR